MLGLRELARVVRPGGRVMLLEHMRAEHRGLGRIMDWLDPIVARILGAHISRRTLESVRTAGLLIDEVEDLAPMGIVRLIVARAPDRRQSASVAAWNHDPSAHDNRAHGLTLGQDDQIGAKAGAQLSLFQPQQVRRGCGSHPHHLIPGGRRAT